MLRQSPSEIQKALLRPGTVEFDAIAAAVKNAKLQESQAQQPTGTEASKDSRQTQQLAATPAAVPVPATQAMDSYLDGVYGNSHRCDSRSPPGMRPNPEPTEASNQAPQQKPKPTEAPDQAPQQEPKPTEASDQAPQQKPKPSEASDQAPQQNKPSEASDQAPQQNKPTEASDQAPQQKPITEVPVPMDVDAAPKPLLSKEVINALRHVSPDQSGIAIEKALQSEQKPKTAEASNELQQLMPPPSTVPVKATQAPPSGPPSSAPSTPGPSDVEDDPELAALADVAHQMKASKHLSPNVPTYVSPCLLAESRPEDADAILAVFRKHLRLWV